MKSFYSYGRRFERFPAATMKSLFKYTYYDSPDGHDLIKKLLYTNKHVSVIGFGLATSEIILISKPFGYMNTLYRWAIIIFVLRSCACLLLALIPLFFFVFRFRRYGQLMLPAYAAATTFCIVTHASTRVRGKDDELNYAIGGFCAGAIIGPLIKHNMVGFLAGVFCAVAGAVKKNTRLNNVKLIPPFHDVRRSVHGDFRSVYRNWTLYEQRPKGWIMAEERKEWSVTRSCPYK